MRCWWLLILMACAAATGPRDPVPGDDDEVAAELGSEGDEDDSPAVAEPSGTERSLLDEVSRELAAMRSSRYSHATHVSEPNGRYDVDCSGLVDYALGRAAPRALAELRAATVRRPLAKHFVAFFRALAPGRATGRWRPIGQAVDLAPGDVLAWLRPADVSSHNTGHVMVVRDRVVRAPHDVNAFVVPVVDATAVPHGKTDARKAAHATGLGTGEVVLIVDGAGSPIAYRWSRGKTARAHATTIAMGRVE